MNVHDHEEFSLDENTISPGSPGKLARPAGATPNSTAKAAAPSSPTRIDQPPARHHLAAIPVSLEPVSTRCDHAESATVNLQIAAKDSSTARQ